MLAVGDVIFFHLKKKKYLCSCEMVMTFKFFMKTEIIFFFFFKIQGSSYDFLRLRALPVQAPG